jgi:hypothetical protein
VVGCTVVGLRGSELTKWVVDIIGSIALVLGGC